ncbi:Uncharacterized protein Fot_33693 [Forsythia ovata]|uniref:Transmembrane protein n=1 Tax=Forsythia ovata TaxID=205694 RepID=A0ABD1TBD7_9LAMI
MTSFTTSSSSSSPLNNIYSSWRVICVFFIGVLLINSCIAIRPMEDDVSKMVLKYYQKKGRSLYNGLIFTRLPKGDPVPPSGPSKGHNKSSFQCRTKAWPWISSSLNTHKGRSKD